ncbi:hypothetical protein NEUTE1DRAFT_89996 [Neurospora tetrasperma FGSC 2508]|uniref:Uncharacterized protein n=1 Tax=Neurospora tetrasperma (strain FGSC 2508 / ATCC MYA-4615 / P0657) TaxID=510951 RepID=F8MZU3_NEUT8|nr:uncharacterized protein NEUTE1DRAFT_89996 [Neurospora tetrasperma FGSC 2508]EGO52080.1 hypothetical protein NEUTE1DRAFT_89996 [Neurospora tetrasperma FGSC 2508]
MSGNQDDTTVPVYYSHHSYLFAEITKKHPNLTTEELENEFKTKVEGSYATKLFEEYGAFYHISRDQVDAFKALVADELMWTRYIYDKPEVGLTLQQGTKLVAKFRAKIAELKEAHAAERKKLQSEHRAVYEAFYKGACADYSSQIKELSAENERLKEENAEVKRLNQALLDVRREEQFDKFEVLLGAKMDLEKDVKRKQDRIKDLEDKVAELKKHKGLAEESARRLEYIDELKNGNKMLEVEIKILTRKLVERTT